MATIICVRLTGRAIMSTSTKQLTWYDGVWYGDRHTEDSDAQWYSVTVSAPTEPDQIVVEDINE